MVLKELIQHWLSVMVTTTDQHSEELERVRYDDNEIRI